MVYMEIARLLSGLFLFLKEDIGGNFTNKQRICFNGRLSTHEGKDKWMG